MKHRIYLLAIALVAIAAIRITATYGIFNHTVDAPIHIACGLEWLEHGTYTLEAEHPPLSRIATAIGPYLAGVRLPDNYQEIWASYRVVLGNIALVGDGQYFRNLSLAKLGVLFFFVISCVFVWVWAKRDYGIWPAVICLGLYTSLPPVLAHASVAETDMTLAANLTGALLAFVFWLRRPTVPRAALMGVMLGLSLISKFTTLLFFPPAAAAVAVWKWVVSRQTRTGETDGLMIDWRKLVPQALLTVTIVLVILWGGYGFEVGDLRHSKLPGTTSIEWISWYSMPLRDVLAGVASNPIFPAPPFFEGIQDAAVHGRTGHDAYLLGEMRKFGIWYFYPLMILIKTPIPFLLLCVFGIVALAKRTRENRD